MYPCMQITAQTEGESAPGSSAHTKAGVLAVCDLSRGGRAALRWAADAARSRDMQLTVVEVVRRERSDVGCGHCRQGAALWNQHLDEITSERLARAQAVIGDGPRVSFEVAEEPAVSGLAQVAARVHADLIVLPRHGLGWRRGASTAARLRQLGEWSVTVVP
jgi:nucleotide-binding universal stress UspA family protein